MIHMPHSQQRHGSARDGASPKDNSSLARAGVKHAYCHAYVTSLLQQADVTAVGSLDWSSQSLVTSTALPKLLPSV